MIAPLTPTKGTDPKDKLKAPAIGRNFSQEQMRAVVVKFWRRAKVLPLGSSKMIAVIPYLDADDNPITIEIEMISANKVLVSDKGNTLSRLSRSGIHYHTGHISKVIDRQLREFGCVRHGERIEKEVSLPFDGKDIHAFAESLSSINHLHLTLAPKETSVEKTAASTNTFTVDAFRSSITKYWNQALLTNHGAKEITAVLPQVTANGVQIAAAIQLVSENKAIIHDRGATLMELADVGIEVHSGPAANLIDQALKQFNCARVGHRIVKELSLPFNGPEIHSFAKGIASISHAVFTKKPPRPRVLKGKKVEIAE